MAARTWDGCPTIKNETPALVVRPSRPHVQARRLHHKSRSDNPGNLEGHASRVGRQVENPKFEIRNSGNGCAAFRIPNSEFRIHILLSSPTGAAS